MNILHLAPELQTCGSAWLALDLACRLQELGQTENALMAPPLEDDHLLTASGVERIPGPRPGLWSLLTSKFRIQHTIQRLETDIVLAYGARAAWQAGRAVQALPEGRRPKIIGVATTYPNFGTTVRGLSHCDAFTAVSRSLREALEKFSGIMHHKGAWVIPYGVQEKQCNPTYGPSADWLKRWDYFYPNPAKQPTLCLPGAITPRHGQEDLIPLLSALHRNGIHPRVLIAGDEQRADQAYLRSLRAKLEESGYAQDIVWLGAHRDMRDVFCASDIILSLNKEPAAYDRPILEALSLGCPVVGYDHGVVGEMLTTYLPEGRIAPGQTEAMADTIYQWSIYPPDTTDRLLYPYRMADTAENYMSLFRTLLPNAADEEEPQEDGGDDSETDGQA